MMIRIGSPLGVVRAVTFLVAPLLLASCATVSKVKKNDPEYLFDAACTPGQAIQSVNGSVWLKATSKEASGQFPALVEAKNPDQLKLEVTNLLGGTEAVIRVSGSYYTIQSAKSKSQRSEGYGSWGGIPLNWATDLFLGRIPCPKENELQRASMKVGEKGELIVDVESAGPDGKAIERYTYEFKTWAGELWPEKMRWKSLSGSRKPEVSFEFEQPEDNTRSPLRWKADSDRGQVKVRWKDRDVTT